ncbi:unnamed protein product [Rotaria sp. Silwood2]|nr:unnamed protein product [Rotaria sp. Silwood2]
MYIDRYTPVRGGRWSDRLRRLSIWSIVSNYFPIKLIKTEDLDPNRNYIFGYHPHGAATVGAGINFLTEATHFSTVFPGIRPHLMGLHSNFSYPVLRELFLGLGNAVVIVTGGMKELYLTEYQRMIFYLKKRKGFIRLALENGASLVPVITFGENEHYRQYKNWISNRWIWGRSIVGYLPLRHPVTTVGKIKLSFQLDSMEKNDFILLVGKPIHVNQIIDPSQIDIDQLHDQYLQAIEQLYNTNKANYSFENVKLEII